MERPTGTVSRSKTTKVKNRCMKPPRRVSPLPAVDELRKRISGTGMLEPQTSQWLVLEEKPRLAHFRWCLSNRRSLACLTRSTNQLCPRLTLPSSERDCALPDRRHRGHLSDARAELCVVNVLSVEGTGPRGNRRQSSSAEACIVRTTPKPGPARRGDVAAS